MLFCVAGSRQCLLLSCLRTLFSRYFLAFNGAVYFAGRGPNTPAFAHAVSESHHVFFNFSTQKVHCLPEDYEVHSHPIIDRIKQAYKPHYSSEAISQLDKPQARTPSIDAFGVPFVPGFLPLNTQHLGDVASVVLLMMCHVPPIRNAFLALDTDFEAADVRPNNNKKIQKSRMPVICHVAELCKKVWNAGALKGHVAPHEIAQCIAQQSSKPAVALGTNDAFSFITWLLNTMSRESLSGSQTASAKSIAPDLVTRQTFQGELNVLRRKADDGAVIEMATLPFFFLNLQLPTPPLFQAAVRGSQQETQAHVQVSLESLLAPFLSHSSGVETVEQNASSDKKSEVLKSMSIVRYPPFLMLFTRRIHKNAWDAVQHNHTIVTFPLQNLRLPLCDGNQSEAAVFDLLACIALPLDDASAAAAGTAAKKRKTTDSSSASLRLFLRCKATERWLCIQDLRVEEVAPQTIFLAESIVQVCVLLFYFNF